MCNVFKVSDDAVDATNSSGKKWFVYLSEALQTSTNYESCLEDYYVDYEKHLRQLMEWCHPHAYDLEVKLWPARSNFLAFLPCGLVNDVKKHTENKIQWRITVNIAFYINVTFSRFEIRDSGEECSSTNLKIGEYRRGVWRSRWYWSYCGNRRPWWETILSNRALLEILQKDLYSSFNVSFMYYIINQDNYLRSELYYKENILNRLQELYYYIEHSHCIRWIIKLHICYVAHFTIVKLMNFVGHFYIYDGPSEKYGIFSLKQTTRDTFVSDVDITSEYYCTVVKLMPHKRNKDFYGQKVMQLSFKKKMREKNTLLNLNNRIRVHNDGHILLAAVYSISGEVGQYPNVTFNIRRFQGWNEGGCNMGGFALVQQMPDEDRTLVTSGPYCPGGSSNQPFITEHGQKFIVLTRKETILVIYAYGPEYWIDLDVIVSVSLCEGLLDFPLLCEAGLAVSHTVDALTQWNNFQLKCNRFYQRNIFPISVRLIRFTGCVVAQVIMCWKVFAYEVEILSRMHVNFKYASPVLYNIGDDIFNISFILIFWKNIGPGPQHFKILNSTRILDIGNVTSLTYRQEAKVSHHESSVTIVMVPDKTNLGSINKHCELINQSAKLQSRQMYVAIENIKLTSLCATGYYHEVMTYVFTIVPTYMTRYSSYSNVYFDIQEQNCGDLIDVSSNLTVTMRASFTQTFHITSNKTIEIEVPNVSILIAVEKHETCSTLIFQYRVALMTLHDVTRTAILKNKFQVFIKAFGFHVTRATYKNCTLT